MVRVDARKYDRRGGAGAGGAGAMKFTAANPPDATPAGARIETIWGMTVAWLRFAAFVALAVLCVVGGVTGAVEFRSWYPLAAGLVLALIPALVAFLLWVFTLRTQSMIYPDGKPGITGEPVLVFVYKDKVKTPKGWVEKEPETVKVKAKPGAVLEALRWMKATGQTSRNKVCDNTNLSQPGWKSLTDELKRYGVLTSDGLTDEIDHFIAQIEAQLR